MGLLYEYNYFCCLSKLVVEKIMANVQLQFELVHALVEEGNAVTTF